jgi:hypothetical protein
METKIAEISDGIYRLSTYVPHIAEPAGFAFNSFLIRADRCSSTPAYIRCLP